MTALDPFGAFVERVPVEGGRGPLAGLSVAVKDSIEVAGRAFTAGHPLFAVRKGVVTAPVVRRLLDAGGAVAGMTRTDAGGFGVTGAGVANPRFPDLIAGGSTGGGGAAVAGGLADLALGTDTAGSLRIPAACVGAIGFKASHGAADMAGIWPLAPTFDSIGFIAAEWEPLRCGVTALLPQRPKAAASLGTRLFAIEGGAEHRRDASTRDAFATLCRDLAAIGHRVVTVRLPDRRTAVRAFSTIVRAEAGAFYASLPPFDRGRLGAAAQAALAHVARHDGGIDAARAVVVAFAAETLQALRDVDALIAPTLPIDVPHVGDEIVELAGRRTHVLEALITETCLANLCGGAAIAMPSRIGPPRQPPFSFCLSGAPNTDLHLLDVAETLARTLPVPADG